MDTENFVVDNRCQGQIIEYFCAVSPDIDWAIFAKAFIIKAINLSDLSTLVIASYKSDTFRVSDFKSEQEEESLNRVVASIYEIAHE